MHTANVRPYSDPYNCVSKKTKHIYSLCLHRTLHTHTNCTQVPEQSSINFPRMDDLGLEYSVFYVARYTGGRMGRVIDGKTNNW